MRASKINATISAALGLAASVCAFAQPPMVVNAAQRAQANVVTSIPTARGHLLTFDVPGGNTYPVGITPSGDIAGYSCDSLATVCHGFLREEDGTITSFDIPGDNYGPVVAGINAHGEIAGFVCGPSGVFASCPGFVRTREGEIEIFDPTSGARLTTPGGINDSGAITGYYGDPNGNFHGFVGTLASAFAAFDFPGDVGGTYGTAINSNGTVAGKWDDANSVSHGLVRTTDGHLTSFDPPAWGAANDSIAVTGINSRAEIAGYYLRYPYTANVTQSFVRKPDGTLVSFAVPGSSGTFALGINSAGTTAGFYLDANGPHGLLRKRDGSLRQFEVPGAAGDLFPMAIAPEGKVAVTGSWADSSGISHGFLFVVDADE
jgi:hypothetical protein